jgi:hypothetical protein
MMDVLIAACPTFRADWEAFRYHWQDEPDLPYYVALGDLARHLIGLLELGDHAALTEAFRAIERLLIEGDAYVQEAAALGLLENLQNSGLHRTTEPAQFSPYLLPASAKTWNQLNDFWEGRGLGGPRGVAG